MTTLQKRRITFWLGLVAISAFLFHFLPWYAALVVLFFLLIFLSEPLGVLYKRVVHRPVHTPEYQPSPQPEEEYPPYEQGLSEVPSYQSPIVEEAPITTEDQPQAQYPQQMHY